MFRTGKWLAALAFIAACQPAQTEQLIQGDVQDLQRKVEVLNARVQRAEDSSASYQKSLADLEKTSQRTRADQSVLMEDLRTELKTLKGNLEILRHDYEQSTKTQEKLHQDFDERLGELETRVSNLNQSIAAARPDSKERPKVNKGKASSESDQISRYNSILRILQRKDYDAAIPQFRDFVKDNPGSTYSANAQYWLGECYFGKGDYVNAAKEFQSVVDNYPESDKTCDARLKQGYAFDELKQPDKAKLFLTEVLRACPKTKSASLATDRLRSLADKDAKK